MFGKVGDGMEEVDRIVSLPAPQDRPLNPPVMVKVTVTGGAAYPEPEKIVPSAR